MLVIGCGDVGLRLLHAQAGKARFIGTARRHEQLQLIRTAGARALEINLDPPHRTGVTVADAHRSAPGRRSRLTGLANHLIYLAPPSTFSETDTRLQWTLAQLDRRQLANPLRLAYCSTTGVYGDADGHILTESSPINPQSVRAKRRANAEHQLRRRLRTASSVRPQLAVLRAPGIYAQDRLPLARLQKGTPALAREHDSYSSHIHADDLANILWTAMLRGPSARTFNACDGDQQLMGDYFDQIATHFGLPLPPRMQAEDIKTQVTPMMWSFMRESRRLSNRRLLSELRVRLQYPNVAATLATVPSVSAS